MPGHLLHIQLARSLVDDPHRAPNWRQDPEAVNALFHGALGPDMGYFPGADDLLSGLAHYLRPVTLARAILDRASSTIQQAYAWGWVTHLLADASIHPIVNRAAGVVDYGTSCRPSTAADSKATHVRVELGLDAARMAREPDAETFRLKPVLDAGTIRMVGDAYRRTYGFDFGLDTLERSLRALTRFQPLLFRGVGLLGRLQSGKGPRIRDLPLLTVYATVRVLSWTAPRSIAFGATHPVTPWPWLETKVGKILDSFPETIHRHLATGLSDLPELNLDTGVPDDSDSPYPPAEETRRELARRRG